jgi:hypothetical protein
VKCEPFLFGNQALTSFLASEGYSPLLGLVTGLSTYVGLWGVGAALLFFIRLRLPPPWNHVCTILLGIQVLSLVVCIAGMAAAASQLVLRLIWWALVTVGAGMLVLRSRRGILVPFAKPEGLALLPIAITATAVAFNLLVALAPSTKIDELYYHMLVPSRIVLDGALRFYREPWEGAIWPHMIFQVSSAPTHAIGYPDAPNIISWGLSATLLWFAWQIIRKNGKPMAWTAFWTAGLCVGMYPVVWHVTGGAHAMGDLAIAAAIVAFFSRERLLSAVPPISYAALMSILLLAASSSKVSLLPLCLILLCLVACSLFWSAPPLIGAQCALAMAAPWIIFFCPIALWTWWQSGSPFGPMLADVFAPSIESDRLREVLRNTRQVNQVSLAIAIKYAAVMYSPIIWLAVGGALFGTDLSKAARAIMCFLLGFQLLLIYWLLPHDVRFLGGLHYGLLIVFASFVAVNVSAKLASRRVLTPACLIFLLPWLGVQVFYAKQFLPVVLGLQDVDVFYRRYIAFYADFVELDRLLPKDAVLLVPDFRLDSIYAPRPVYFDIADLPPGKQVVLFASPETTKAARAMGHYQIGELIYENFRAVTAAYRTPGNRPEIGPLHVVRLHPIE